MPTARETGRLTEAGVFVSRVSWGSVLLGVVITFGIMLLLTLLGVALGASVVDPQQETDPLSGIPTGTAIYFTVSHTIALAIGGYAAARLASSAWSSAAVLHGVAVWASAALLSVAVATTAVGSLLSGSASMIGAISGGAAQAIQAIVPEDIDLPDIDALIPKNFVSTLPPEVQQTLEGQDLNVEDVRQEARAILQEVITEEERRRARQAIMSTAAMIARDPAEASQEIQELTQRFTGEDGLISEQDGQRALAALEQRLGMSPKEAEAVLAQWQQTLEDAAEGVTETLDNLQQQAVKIAQQVTDNIAAAAWWAFTLSVLGLIAAIVGAMVGRPDRHRL